MRCAYFTTSLRVDRVSIAFRSEKESVQHRGHANFAPNSREKIVKLNSGKNSARRRPGAAGATGAAGAAGGLRFFLATHLPTEVPALAF